MATIKISELVESLVALGIADNLPFNEVDGGSPTGFTTKRVRVDNSGLGDGGGDNGMFGIANEGSPWAVTNYSLGGATTQTGSAVNTFTHTGGDYIIEGAVELELFKIDFSLDTVNISGGFNVNGPTVLNEDDTIDTLIIGNDSVGNLRAGIIFNSDYVTPSRIYDRSDGTHNKGMTLQSRDDIFEFINAGGVTNTAQIQIGEITQLRFLKGTTNAPLIIQGASTPNDAGDGVSIETADNINVMTERFKIEGDAEDVKAYLNNVSGFVIGSTTLDDSSLLEIKSTTKGLRITPMTAIQALAITPVEGLQVFVSTTSGVFATVGLHSYESGAWVKL